MRACRGRDPDARLVGVPRLKGTQPGHYYRDLPSGWGAVITASPESPAEESDSNHRRSSELHFGGSCTRHCSLSVLSPSYGLVNSVLHTLGRETIHFVAYPGYFRGILVIVDIWRYTGWDAIIYLAAITSIDPGQYEAAIIDVANRFGRIWHITLPGISEIIVQALILRIGAIMQADFEMIFLL